MTISELIETLPITLSHGSACAVISDIVEDSRAVTPGCLFVARQGERADGRQYISAAIKAGATAILTDFDANVPNTVAALRCDDVTETAARAAEHIFGHPSRAFMLIGITGTNGKTTVAHLIHQLYTAAGHRCGMIGTININDGVHLTPAELTTPSAIDISRLLRQMVDNNCKACVMEVSSHALQQGRVAALRFDTAVFTNLTGDHLDYHGTMNEYAAAKAKLFSMLRTDGCAIVNMDDSYAAMMLRSCSARIHQCSLTNDDANYCVTINTSTIKGSNVTITSGDESLETHIPLIGKYNVMNAVQAIIAAHQGGVTLQQLTSDIEHCTAPPGRLERVDSGEANITILVDYAHTDDALDNALAALRPLVPDGARLHVVFGCGGDRDRTKRPRMAAAACRWADVIHITSDNPRTEEPQYIIDEIVAGLPNDNCVHWCADVDRKTAIHSAIRGARAGDVILIAGKGHEDYQIIGTTKQPFDDRIVAVQALDAWREVSV